MNLESIRCGGSVNSRCFNATIYSYIRQIRALASNDGEPRRRTGSEKRICNPHLVAKALPIEEKCLARCDVALRQRPVAALRAMLDEEYINSLSPTGCRGTRCAPC